MVRDEAISDIKVGLQRFNTTALDSEILTHLQRAQVRLERSASRWLNGQYPWFLLSEIADIDTTIGEERIPLPTDFLSEHEDGALFRFEQGAADGQDWKALVKEDWDVLRVRYTDNGTPDWYAILGQYFRVKPTPDKVYTLKMVYYAEDQILNTNVENRWLRYAPDLLIGEAGIRTANSLAADRALQYFSAIRSQGQDDLASENEERRHKNRDYQMLFDGRLREGE